MIRSIPELYQRETEEEVRKTRAEYRKNGFTRGKNSGAHREHGRLCVSSPGTRPSHHSLTLPLPSKTQNILRRL